MTFSSKNLMINGQSESSSLESCITHGWMIGETINVVDLTSEEKDITNEGKTEDVSNIAKVNEGLKSSESSYVLSSTDRSKLWISLISKEIDSLQNMTNISRELSDQDPKMAESFINVVRKKMKYTVALLDTVDKCFKN
ncbi:hypothetical protein Tco_1460635 [Tanacetum coccineum]